MKISEIVYKEKDNKDIILHKEGLFWRAYEFSAFSFINKIKDYNVMHKHLKTLGRILFTLVFPVLIMIKWLIYVNEKITPYKM